MYKDTEMLERQDIDALLMGAIDEAREAGRIAEARGRRIKPGWLIAPGCIERMLGDGQEFDMGEAHVAHIRHELVGEFVVTQERAVIMPSP